MDIHIYDMQLDPDDVVILTGDVKPEEIPAFISYLEALQRFFANPVIYIPGNDTIDNMPREDLVSLLTDAMAPETIDYLRGVLADIVSARQEATVDEV